MVSLIEELEAREAAARVRVEELEAKIAELTARLVVEREVWSRLRVTRETVAQALSELSGQDIAETTSLREPVAAEEPAEPEVRVVGAVMVPHRREGLTTDVLPDVYGDIVEVIADAAGRCRPSRSCPGSGFPPHFVLPTTRAAKSETCTRAGSATAPPAVGSSVTAHPTATTTNPANQRGQSTGDHASQPMMSVVRVPRGNLSTHWELPIPAKTRTVTTRHRRGPRGSVRRRGRCVLAHPQGGPGP